MCANYTIAAIFRDILVANIGNFCDRIVRQLSVHAVDYNEVLPFGIIPFGTMASQIPAGSVRHCHN